MFSNEWFRRWLRDFTLLSFVIRLKMEENLRFTLVLGLFQNNTGTISNQSSFKVKSENTKAFLKFLKNCH